MRQAENDVVPVPVPDDLPGFGNHNVQSEPGKTEVDGGGSAFGDGNGRDSTS
jgi:hypothetical protein